MKRHIAPVILFLLITSAVFSQVSINSTGSAPAASAMLDVSSTTSGLLIPRMTSAQRTGIGSAADGLIVFDTDLSTLCFFRAGVWRMAAAVSTGSSAANQVAFWDASGSLSGNNNFSWNNSSSRLGIGTASPNEQLELTGSFRLPLTTSSTTGVIYKGTSPFIHNYKPAGRTGCNTFVGELAGNFSMSGSNVWEASCNTAAGYFAMNNNFSGYNNTAVGAYTLMSNTTGYKNTAVGYNSLNKNTFGYNNTAIGSLVLDNNTLGYFNTGCGIEALFANTTGNYNTAVGVQSLTNNTWGSNNTALGESALQNDTTASGNTALGASALDSYVNGNNNTAVGYLADVSVTKLTNITAIGYNAIATASNQVRLGDANIQTFYCKGAWQSTSSSNPNMVVDANGQIMQSTATIPSGTGTAGQLAYWSGSGILAGNSNLFWDNANSRLGIGTNTPSQKLEVKGGNLLISNTGTAGEIWLAEPSGSGTNYTSFKAQAQAANLIYTLPAAYGANGNVLSTTSTGTLSWITPTAGDITAVGSMTTGDAFADGTADNDWLGLGAAAGRIEFDDQATDEVNILAANVGIGTSAPSQQLELTGNLELPATTALSGIIYSATIPFLHNFGTKNVFLGELSGNLTLSGGVNNTGVGDSTLFSISSGDYNAAIGTSALRNLTTGQGNTVVGVKAGMTMSSPTNEGWNTIIGYQAGKYTNSERNTFIGTESGMFNTAGSFNVFVGHQSGYHNTTGNNSTSLGYRALFTQTGNTTDNDLNNTAIGFEALYSDNPTTETNGRENVAVGHQALRQNQTGYDNSAVGSSALYTNSTGHHNTAVGAEALKINSTGDYNTALGAYALSLSTSSSNTGLGRGALEYATSGQNNTAVGAYALDQLSTGSYNTAVGYMANVNATNCSNSIAIGYATSVTANDQVRLGDDNIQTFYCKGAYNGVVGSTNLDLYVDNDGKIGHLSSSARYKDDIFEMQDVKWIYQLRPVNFTYKSDDMKKQQYGLIAEEVEKVNPAFVSYNSDGSVETVSYSQLISPMIKALQEQNDRISDLESEIDLMKAERELLISRLQAMEKR